MGLALADGGDGNIEESNHFVVYKYVNSGGKKHEKTAETPRPAGVKQLE